MLGRIVQWVGVYIGSTDRWQLSFTASFAVF